MGDTVRPASDQLQAGVRVSVVSIVWTVFASATSIIVGVEKSSLVLVAFGCTGLLDAAGSSALVIHFRHAIRHETFSARREHVALMVVTGGLVVVAVSTAAESIHRLVNMTRSEHTTVGVAVAATSVVVLSGLSRRKISLGKAIPSHALVADGWLSATGAGLATVTVLGTVLSGLGWWWADPAAALAVACGALVVGVMLAREPGDDA